MEIRTETVEIDGEEFEIRELTVAEMLPTFRIGEDDDSAFGSQLALMRASVHQDGEPLGDALDALPGRAFRVLAPLVTKLNGLSEAEEGN